MAIYRQVYIGFWSDKKIEQDFSPEDKYFYLYLMTNTHTNICGCYEIGIGQMSKETGYNEDTVKKLLKRMTDEHKVIEYDYLTDEVLILNWSKYNWSKSQQTLAGIKKVSKFIKSEVFRQIIDSKVDCLENNTVPYRGHIGGMVASVSDSVININNINKDIDFDLDDAFYKILDIYPKKTSVATAKVDYLQLMKGLPNNVDRKEMSIDICDAINLYVKNYRQQNKDDQDFKYMVNLSKWFKEELEYWSREVDKCRQKREDL